MTQWANTWCLEYLRRPCVGKRWVVVSIVILVEPDDMDVELTVLSSALVQSSDLVSTVVTLALPLAPSMFRARC